MFCFYNKLYVFVLKNITKINNTILCASLSHKQTFISRNFSVIQVNHISLLNQENTLEFLDPIRRGLKERAVHLDFLVIVNATRLGAVGMVGGQGSGMIRRLHVSASLRGMPWVDTWL